LTTRLLLAAQADEAAHELNRRRLQELGDLLDRQRGGQWIQEALSAFLAAQPDRGLVVIDSVRTADQADAVLRVMPTFEVHLTAPLDVLTLRYEHRRLQQPSLELDSYQSVLSNATEAAVTALAHRADLVIDTSLTDEGETLQIVLAELRRLGLLPHKSA
jgi:hypothetical protein